MKIQRTVATAIWLGAGLGAALAQTTTLNVIVGQPPAGAYDLYGRLVSRHIQKHLPGTSSVVVRNMPGAGSLTAANFLFNNAPRDGSTIGTFSRGIPVLPIFEPEGVRYDPTKFIWLGSPAQDISVTFSWHTTAFRSHTDLLQREMSVGATGSGGDSLTFANAINRLIGTKLKVITGYPGANDYFIAIERGELDGSSGTSWSNLTGPKADWLKNNKINVLLQLGVARRDDIPAPLVTELAKTDLDRKALELIFSRQLFAYPFAAPPQIPEAAAQRLRDAFAAATKDPELLAEAKRMAVDIEPTTGADIQKLIETIYAAPPEVIERARFAIRIER